MNESSPKIKQQIVDKIKSSTNILVTVSNDPSIDALSAAIGFTTILNKLNKHGTAIFSGKIPPAIGFLEPNKVFENTADSLRDFIIALDKEKADHLRYKVEGDVVKIFITPYRTTISSDDLDFSQGDYNIELVIALGVDNQDHLDAALLAHGQVLHDVTVATFSAGKQSSQLGSMDWRDSGASSLSEMVANFSELLKVDKPVLDKQISTALLTGIVAATDRFSNLLTTSRVMTTAAQLMATGADQQLIAARLQESHEIDKLDKIPVVQKIIKQAETIDPVVIEEEIIPTSTLPVGSLVIEHGVGANDSEKKLDDIIATSTSASALPNEYTDNTLPTQPELKPRANMDFGRNQGTNSAANNAKESTDQSSKMTPEAIAEPRLGGSLNATVDQAFEDRQREIKNDQNKTILTHSYLGGEDKKSEQNPINGIGQAEPSPVDIFNGSLNESMPEPIQNNNYASVQSIVQPPVPDLPLPPQLPDFSTLPPISPAVSGYSAPISQQPEFNQSQIPHATSDPGRFIIPGQQ